MENKLWEIISNPPMIKIQGVSVQAWQVPSIEDRTAIVKEIAKRLKKGHLKSKRCKRCRTTKYNNDYYNLLRKNIGKINENSLKRRKKNEKY